jgi:hypothetical protein
MKEHLEPDRADELRRLRRSRAWFKLKRETARLGGQSLRMFSELLQRLYFNTRYDRRALARTVLTQGSAPASSEVAIYLIFPEHGVQWSHLSALAEMRAAGIEPFVISNLPLAVTDRERLLPHCARLMERPNVGYDFGGYRAGILHLADRLPSLNRLWLLNDSVWMVPQAVDWFTQARALGTDFVAASLHHAVKAAAYSPSEPITWHQDVRRRNFHYASFALGIGARVLKDPGFARFWRRLQIRNDKSRTVRNGEIGLSQWIIRNGYSHGATCGFASLDADLQAMDDAVIDDIARNTIVMSGVQAAEMKRIILRSDFRTEAGRRDRIWFILAAVSWQGSSYAVASHAIARCGFQFLKKSPMRLDADAAAIMAGIIAGIPSEAGAQITREGARIMRA